MEKHGRGKRRTFSAEYKAEAVRLVDETVAQISSANAKTGGNPDGAIERRWPA